MTLPPVSAPKSRLLRRIWTWIIVAIFVLPWVFAFTVTNGPGFTDDMVAAGPLYLVQAAFFCFLSAAAVGGAAGLVAQLVVVRDSPRSLQITQGLGVVGLMAFAVVSAVFVFAPAMRWAF